MTSTSSASSSSTPSLAPVCGASPPASPGGPTIGRSGRGVAPAKAGPPPANERASKTLATSGRISFDSSPPAGPLSSWVRSLQDRLSTRGSTELHLTWKVSVTPAGRSIYRLAPSTLRTGETGSGGSHWPTPTANPDNKSPEAHLAMKQRMGERDGTNANRTAITDLQVMMKAEWPTPTVADIEGGRKTRSGSRNDEMLLNGLMATWVSPQAMDGNKGRMPPRPHDTGVSLPQQIAQTWATPAARDWRSDRSQMTSEELYGTKGRPLARQLTEASGWTPNGSPVPTEKRGAPNANFAAWLMGWPENLIVATTQAIIAHKLIIRSSSKGRLVAPISGVSSETALSLNSRLKCSVRSKTKSIPVADDLFG